MIFQLGDTVRLKSGGPIMTVSAIDDSTVECTWFGADGEVKFHHFRAAMLEKEE